MYSEKVSETLIFDLNNPNSDMYKIFWKFEVSGVIAVNPGIQIFQVSGVIAVKMSVL